MTKSNFLFGFLALSGFWINQAIATTFAEDPNYRTPVHVKEADFLKAIGIVSVTSRDKHDSDLIVSFTSSKTPRYSNHHTELHLVNSQKQFLLTITRPFVNANHSVSYRIPEGHSLVIAIAMPLNDDMEYYRVTFSNDL